MQICKEPLGTKGARLTCNITLPCRNLVFMPMTDHIGISRKIEDETVRKQLRQDIETLRPAGTGFIVRTVAENATNEDLEADMEFLLHTWGRFRISRPRPQSRAWSTRISISPCGWCAISFPLRWSGWWSMT